MGLLDSLFAQSTYGGQGGGLLDFLRTTQMQQEQYQPSAGFPGQAPPVGIGGYQMPRIGDMAQFTPSPADPAALPPNAQPAQGQLPMQQPMAQPDIGDRFLSGIRALGNPDGLLNRLADAGSAFAGGPTRTNQTAQFLVSKGIEPAMAKTIVSDPSLLRTILPQLVGFGRGQQPAKVQEYLFAKQEDPTLTYAKFLQKERSTNEYGMQPLYTVNDKGETEAWQLGKDGKPVKVELPAGSKIAKGIEKIDAGTKWILRDKQTGSVIGDEPKNVANKEAEEKVGQARGIAQAALNNGADIDAEKTIKKIDEFANSKGFNEVFGQFDQYRPSWTHSNAGTDALARYKQLKGTAFLSAYAMLKGGGAITDIEGQKAGDAMARLDRAQSEDEAKQALADFKDAVETGLRKLRRAANGGAEPAAATSPATNLKAKYGLD
jgi:hypothetical protein